MRTLPMLLCFAFMQLLSSLSHGQCRSAPPLDPFLGTEATVVNNEVLAVGTKKWFYGAPATFSQLTLRGGTLIVCTDLTINVLNMDSGTIVVRPGAKLTAGGGGSGMIWRGNCALYNYGRLEITSNLSFEGPYATAAKPNILMNATATSSSRAFNYLVINNPYSFFVNKGLAEFHGIITDNNAVAGSVCLQHSSQLKQTVLINKIKDAYTAPEGYACVSVYQFSQFTDTLTNDPLLLVCLSAGHTSATGGTNRPNAWGSANLFQTCNSCAEVSLLAVQPPARPPVAIVPDEPEPIKVFPNPFRDVVHLRWSAGKKPVAVRIFDNTGRVVYYRSLLSETGTGFSLPLSWLPAGTHIAAIVYQGKLVIRKIAKEKS